MTAAIIDNTALVYLGQISLAMGDPSLDTLLNPNVQLVKAPSAGLLAGRAKRPAPSNWGD